MPGSYQVFGSGWCRYRLTDGWCGTGCVREWMGKGTCLLPRVREWLGVGTVGVKEAVCGYVVAAV